VGPNGSGKSNVIDALLFVFGKRASQLRHKTVAELIHHSDKFPNLQFCQVAVHFQEIIDTVRNMSYPSNSFKDDGKYEVVPGSSVIISRRAKKNNSSDYYMNGKKSSFTEVEKWLNTKGIDLDNNRFLILQGEVEQIAMMKPKSSPQHGDGLLEYLEEIIGSNKYVEMIEKKAQEIEEATEARQSTLNRVKVAEKEREGLEGAKTEAEEFLQKERDIIDKRSILYQIGRKQAEEEISNIATKRDELETRLKEEREQAQDSTTQLEELETQYKKGKREYEQIEEQMAKAKSDFAVYERKQVKYQEDLKHYKKKEKQLTETVATEHRKVKEKSISIDTYKQDISKNEKEVENLANKVEQEQKKLDAIYASLKEETADLQVELEQKQKELMPWSKKISEQQSKYDLAKSELDLAKDRFDTASKNLEEIQSQMQNIKENLPKKKKTLVESRKTLEESKVQLEKAKKDLKKVSQDEVSASEVVRTLRNQLEEAKSAAKDASNKSHLLKSLMDAKSKKKLSGIHGRLGDLGTIPSKYDVAISTACGALNNIVVDTTSNAEKCIQFIRENKLGVVTCIILEQQKSLENEIGREFKAPPKSERLFDLIKPKEDQYLPAFYYALRNTLVSPDLDTATKIAYDGNTRHRVVTLNGELIDTSGTMSGGGNNKQSGGMKASFSGSMSDDELAKLQKEFESKAEELQDLRRRKQELEANIESLTSQIATLEVEIPKLDMDISTMGTHEKELKARIPELEASTKMSSDEQKQISALQKVVNEREKELNDTKKQCSKLEETVQELQKQIMEAGGTKLRVQKSKVESLNNQIDTINAENTKLKVKIKTTEKEVKKATASAEEAEKQLEQVQASLNETRDEAKSGEEQALKVTETYKETEKILEDKGKELKVIQKSFEKLKKVVDKFRAVEVELQNQLEDLNRVVKDNQVKAQNWSKKIADLNKQKSRTRVEDEEEHTEENSNDTLPVLSVEELESYDTDELHKDIAVLEEALAKMKPNMNAIREYRKKEREYNERVKELEAATEKRDSIRKEYEGLRKKRLDEFMAGFGEITLRLKEMYQMITLGGDAELELVDSLDPFSEGIVFSVRPPKKSWKNISNLSGGEVHFISLSILISH
jgi:structural maintenance of chromosome 4